jgi:hypothetical protein
MANRAGERLSRRAKVFYGVGDTGFNLTGTISGWGSTSTAGIGYIG